MKQFCKIIENLDCASRRTFKNSYIAKSFRIDDIQSGWMKSSYTPTAASKNIFNFNFEEQTINRWSATWMNNAGTLAKMKKKNGCFKIKIE
jgi:hypothetical protein